MAIRTSDQISIVDLTDGYSVNLSSDAFTFAGDTTKVKSTQTFTTVVQAFCGSSTVSAAVDTTSLSLPAGLSVTSDEDAASPALTFTATTALTQATLTSFGGMVDLPILVDGEITVHKRIALAIALTGSTGTAAYSILVGNEAQVLACDKDGKTLAASTITIPFSVFQGTSRKACTVTYSTLPSGITLHTNGNVAGTTSAEGSLTLDVAAASNLGGSSSGEITLTFSVGSTTIGTKVFTWSKSITGATGSTGSSAQWYSGTGITGGSTTATAFPNSGVSSAKVGDMYLNTTTQNIYRCTVSGAASAAKWVYVSNIKGTTGISATNVVCGNESVSIACTLDGKVKAATTITIPFAGYIGTTRAACTLADPTLPSGMSQSSNTAATANADGSFVISVAANATLGSATTYSGEIELVFSCNSHTIRKRFSWSKSLTGATGAKGDDAITMVITSSNGTIFKNTGVSTTLTAHVDQAGTELTATQIAALGTIKWYKDGSSTALATTGATLSISASDVVNKASYIAQLEG